MENLINSYIKKHPNDNFGLAMLSINNLLDRINEHIKALDELNHITEIKTLNE